MSEPASTNSSGLASQGAATAVVLLCAFLAGSPAVAQQANAVPDFVASPETAWRFTGDDFLPPPNGPGPVVHDQRYPYVSNRVARETGTKPTYRVADLGNPILQPWAIEQMRKANEEVLAGKVPFRARERCYPAGVPAFLIYTLAEPLYFIQTSKQVTIINMGGPEVRRIYLNVPHSAHVTPSWYGKSVGHYEGKDTLVVDTIGLSARTFVDNYRTPHTDKLHVVERFKLVGGGEELETAITVEDPGTFTTPWSALQRFRRTHFGHLAEHICAENNSDYFNFGVAPLPQTDKADF